MKLTTYLLFNGNCEEALAFYAKALGGKPVMLVRYSETPAAKTSPPEIQQKIIHGRIAIGDDFIMACDAPPQHYDKPAGFSINIGVRRPRRLSAFSRPCRKRAKLGCRWPRRSGPNASGCSWINSASRGWSTAKRKPEARGEGFASWSVVAVDLRATGSAAFR